MATPANQIKHRDNLLRGVRAVLQPRPQRKYRIPQRGDSARDMQTMRDDFVAVGRDLTYGVEKYVQG